MNYCRFFLFSFWQTLQTLIRDQAGNEWFVTQNSKSEPLFFFLQTNKALGGGGGGLIMAFQRRRQHHNHQHRLRVVVPIISAVFSALLILFALLSFLAPSPSDTDHLHHPRRFTSVCFLSLSPYLPFFPFFLTDLRLTFILSLSIWYADRQRRWSNWSTRFSCSG